MVTKNLFSTDVNTDLPSLGFSPLVLHGTQCVEITGLDDGAGGRTQDLHCSEKCNQTLLGR